MEPQIQDRKKLFDKLFVSATFSEKVDPPLLVSPNFIPLLLEQSGRLPQCQQKHLLDQILQIFINKPMNSLLLLKADMENNSSYNRSILNQMVMKSIELVQSQHDANLYVEKIRIVVSHYRIVLKNIVALCGWLSWETQSGRFNGMKFSYVLRLLRVYYERKIGVEQMPKHYFYFLGQGAVIRSCGLADPPLFKNELCVSVVVSSHASINNLVQLETDKEHINIIHTNKSIMVLVTRKNAHTQHVMCFEGMIKEQLWYRLTIMLEMGRTVVELDGKVWEGAALLHKQRQRKLMDWRIGEAFVGMISSVVVGTKRWPNKHSLGIEQWDHLRELSKYAPTMLFACLPFATFNVRESLCAFDVFHRNHSSISDNIVILDVPIMEDTLTHLGGLKPILPLFYLIRFYDGGKHKALLEDALNIVLTILQHYSYGYIDQQLHNDHWLEILGQHLWNVGEFQTHNTLKLLQKIHKKLYRETTRAQFVGKILWNLNIPQEQEVIRTYYGYMIRVYESERVLACRGYSFTQILYWALQNFEGTYNCCLQHYTNECILSHEFDMGEGVKISQSSKKIHYSYIEIILSNILENIIIGKPELSEEVVKILIRPLLHKYSPCLYVTILQVLKRQIGKFVGERILGVLFTSPNIDLLSFLVFLSEKTINVDIITNIILLCLFMMEHCEGHQQREEVRMLVVQVLRRMREIAEISDRPLSRAVKKVRKYSQPILHCNQVENETQPFHSQEQKKPSATTCPQILNLISKCPPLQSISHYKPLFNTIINNLQHKTTDEEIHSFSITNEKGLSILTQYYCICDGQYQTQILLLLLGYVESDKNVRNVGEWIRMLLRMSYEGNSTHVKMLWSKTLVQAIQANQFGEYYWEIRRKCENASMLLDVLEVNFPVFGKAMSMSQLCTLLTLLKYQQNYQHENSSLLLQTLNQLQNQSLQQLEKHQQPSLFSASLYALSDNEETFSMELILSKLLHNEEHNDLWEENLNKRVYMFEIYIQQIVHLLKKYAIHTNLKSEHPQFYHAFIAQLKHYINYNITNQHHCRSYLRFIVYSLSFQASVYCEQLVCDLWMYIIGDILLPRISEGMKSYEELLERFMEEGCNPVFVEDLEIFIRGVQFEQIAKFVNITGEERQVQLRKLCKESSFVEAVSFGGRIATILNTIYYFNNEQITQSIKRIYPMDNLKEPLVKPMKKNIQKLFDNENILEQNIRIKYLHEQECLIRSSHYHWQEMWDKLRTYHQPYGFWMAQRNHPNIFTYPLNSKRNFKYQISEYASQSGMYPILEPKIIEPWHIVKDMRKQKNKHIHSVSQMMKPSHTETKQQIGHNAFVHLWKKIWKLPAKKMKKVQEYEVLWIQKNIKALGRVFIRDNEEIIFFYEGIKQEDSHLSFQKFSLAYNKKTYCQWPIFQIKKLKVHRYLMRYRALQITFYDTRSVIFQFIKGDRVEFVKELERIQKEKVQITNMKLFKLNNIAFFQEDFFRFEYFHDNLTERWRKREISNLEYLIEINKRACRGIYDLSQYMVMPWVVEVRNEKQPTLRALDKTMGGLGSPERKKLLMQKFVSRDPFNPYPPFFYGTHYNSPGVVFNFLIRLSPFAEYCKHLQGGKFDIPDRLFSSMIGTWKSSTCEVSDVRQLIPEFYYLPEIYINLDEYNFGITQTLEVVNHVQLPSWSTNNPYFFTWQLRNIMQSEEVSEQINNWIDLIFGYKQKGKQAEQSLNIYYYLTYEESIDEHTEDDDDEIYQKSKEAQIVHFGQVPPQLFEKPHPKRQPIRHNAYHLHLQSKAIFSTPLKQRPFNLHILNHELYLIKRNSIDIYKLQAQCVLNKTKKYNLEKSQSNHYYLLKKEFTNVIFLKRGYFVVWGYFNNQFRVFRANSGNLEDFDVVESEICTVMSNREENLLFVGEKSGVLNIYEIEYGMTEVFVKKIMVEMFPAPVTHISEYDGFFCVGSGNLVSVYKFCRSLHYLTPHKQPFGTCKFLRSFEVPAPIKWCFFVRSPLYCMVAIDNASIRTYSINGQFMKRIVVGSVRGCGRFLDGEGQDVLYTVEQEKIVCYSLPDLRSISILELEDHEYIYGRYIVTKNTLWEFGYVPYK